MTNPARAWYDGATLGGYKVERRELPRPGGQAYVPLSNPRVLVVHTTEGSSVAGALSTLGSNYSGPHFVVGEGRIVQTRPLTGEAATLRAHNDVGWQVEAVGRSSQALHRLTPETWGPLVALVRFFHEDLGVPLARPDGWADNGSDIRTIWASDNTRRQSRKALAFRGLVGHLEIPDQDPSWHWDPGALDYSALFDAVRVGVGPDPSEEDAMLDDYIDGQKAARDRAVKADGTLQDPGPAPEDRPRHFQAGWTDVRWDVNRLAGRDGKDGSQGPAGPEGPRGPKGDAATLEPGTRLVVEP